MDRFDHYIKEILRIKYYCRYMDDFYILCRDKEQAKEIRDKITEYLAHLNLELNEKTKIFPLKNGLDFLGFHTYLTDTGRVVRKLRRTSIKRLKGKIKYWRRAYPNGEITKEEILRKFDAWDAHAAHGDTFSLRRKYAEQVGEILGQEIYIRKSVKTCGKRSERIKVGKSERERLDEWYLEEIILKQEVE